VKPHVALLDIGIPGMSGYELCRRIRREAWGEKIIVAAVTGWGHDDDKEKARAAGFDHHFTKPVDPAIIDGVVAAGMRRRTE
jgi:CheY-like chemotaxis protein